MHNSPGFGAEGNSRKKLGKAIGKGAGLFKGKNPAQVRRVASLMSSRRAYRLEWRS